MKELDKVIDMLQDAQCIDIQRLLDECDTEHGGWVSVDDDEKPMDGELVIVYKGHGKFYCHTYMSECGFPEKVTHWMRVTTPEE